MPKLPPRPERPPLESTILAEIRHALGAAGIPNWRNNTGVLRDERGRPVRFGLAPGSPDLIIAHPLTITDRMVGHTVAILRGDEVKTPSGHLSPAQDAFRAAWERAGALYVLSRSPADSLAARHPLELL